MKKKCNKYDLSGEFGIGNATNTDDVFYFDLEDYEKIKYGSWAYVKKDTTSYLINNKDKKYFHRLVMNAPVGKYVDHINHNTLDNRKQNLRICTNQQNAFNSRISKHSKSGVKGVTYSKRDDLWCGEIKENGVRLTKSSKNKEEVVIWRLENEFRIFGEFSSQKHLFEKYNIGVDSDE